MLEIHWREWMTKDFQNRWLTSQAFYVIQLDQTKQRVDNPDQRITEDIPMFISGLVTISFGLLMAVGRLIVFLPILVWISPNYVSGTKIYLPGWLPMVAL